MRAGKRIARSRPWAIYIAAIGIVVAALIASISSLIYIDRELRQDAEQQAIIFTQQAADNVADSITNVENVIEAFEVQSADPADITPALHALRDRFGFTDVMFVDMEGQGVDADGSLFAVSSLEQPERDILSSGSSYSQTFVNATGERARLVQRPLYIEGTRVGSLYVRIPLDVFSMCAQMDMFNGRADFLLFQGSTGEILLPPVQESKASIDDHATLYDFLDKSAQSGGFEEIVGSFESTSGDEQDVRAVVEDIIESESVGLAVGSIDGTNSYLCVAPVGQNNWYVCSVIPADDVRAQASVVTMSFQVVFALAIICFAVVVALVFLAYRKRLQERDVTMKSRLYRALSDSLDMAVNLYSPTDGSITPIVAKAESILGYSMPQLMSDHDHRVADHIELSIEGRTLIDRIRMGTVESLEQGEFFFKHTQTGKPHWVTYAASPLSYENKQQILVVFQDTTAEKELQLSMKDAMTAAEAANRAKSDFLSRMSHEIRTPMNAIIGMLQIAEHHADDAERTRENLKKIAAASDHLLNLINDVLDISKIESGKMVLSSEPFRLSTLIDHVLAVIRSQCDQKNQTLDVVISSDSYQMFVGDPMRLRQLLINLLTNAVKYTPEGGHIRLEVSTRPSTVVAYRCVTFVVADDGIGMTEEFKERLFEPFAMEGRYSVEGTGLGMPIVKNIVTIMGGDIHVDTAVDQGSTFTVMVNLRVALDQERHPLAAGEFIGAAWKRETDGQGQNTNRATSKVPNAIHEDLPGDSSSLGADSDSSLAFVGSIPDALKGMRILLAEDNDLNAEIACELLEEAGFSVDCAKNGDIACRLFDESPHGHYGAVLMDVQMPVLNGYEATRRIRALSRPDARRIPIIAMSANAFADDVRASLESGMDAHLSKPVDMGNVLRTIAIYVQGRDADADDAGA